MREQASRITRALRQGFRRIIEGRNPHEFSVAQRLACYLGRLYDSRVRIAGAAFSGAFPKNQILFVCRDSLVRERNRIIEAGLPGAERTKDAYIEPVISIIGRLEEGCHSNGFYMWWGDLGRSMAASGVYLFAKSRVLGDESVVLLNLNRRRHFRFLPKVDAHDVDFSRKSDRVVWRGATTGTPQDPSSRFEFVRTYFNHPQVDAGFSSIVQDREAYEPFRLPGLSVREQLQHKYIVALEGNDVASGLKWQLYSNSVVLMPPVTRTSWIMEDRLVPFVHFIPLRRDLSDLMLRVDWAQRNEAACREIARNATRYMQQFLRPRRERMIEEAVFRRYFENVEFTEPH